MYDFQKSIQEKNKNVADIQRKLDALSGDNSANARARRAQLESELAEARTELEELYYERSIQDQQDALSKELENFQETKDKEIEGWEEYLEDTNKVVSDSLTMIQANTETVYHTLLSMGEEYGLSITEILTSPWIEGENAIQSFSEKFGLSMSSTVEELTKLSNKYKEIMAEIEGYGEEAAAQANKNADTYQSATKQEPKVEQKAENKTDNNANKEKSINIGDTVTVKKTAKKFSSNSGNKYMASFVPGGSYTVYKLDGDQVRIGRNGVITGWVYKKDLEGYAKGTTGVKEDQWAWLDELGEELELIPDGNGRLSYMKKGTGVVPADLTANLMEWGKLDPSIMLDQNRPQIGVSPSVVNNTTEIHIDASVGELLHVDHIDGSNPAEISKIVDKAWDKRMKELNGYVRRYANR